MGSTVTSGGLELSQLADSVSVKDIVNKQPMDFELHILPLFIANKYLTGSK